jgi:glutamate transport system substrate-binding protein
MLIKRLVAAAAIAVLGVGIAACGGNDPATTTSEAPKTFKAGSTMEKLNKAQKITIGTKFDQPGFGLKGLDGKPAGFDVEIGKLLAKELGIPADKIEWVETKSAVREEVIEKSTVDAVIATYTINDTRKQKVGFAGPYYVAGQHIMVRSDDTAITGPDSFKAGDKKVCSVQGSTPATNIKKYLMDEAKQLVLFGTYAECVDALKNKTVDAVTTDNVILTGFIATSNNAYKLTGTKFTEEPYGIGVKKDDADFRAFINDLLEKIYKDGSYAKAWTETAGKFDKNTPTGPPVNRY